ncbi:M23 family metallopeptidase [Bacillus taeanensis]|uniref:M23 family peptidase n=1 Tax=Bacillus taeanensis TaxID=273032 RepID=A0A366XS80_9BACI|nr:M23 family metallopeptidase [Bacillus taeanensis]RBW68747.1 M23 family peptidase [Bacillus taeanensis]
MKDENKNSSRVKEMPTKLQKLARKRWVFPAVYIGFAAIVLVTVLWMQSGSNEGSPNTNTEVEYNPTGYEYNDDAVAVNARPEVFKQPVIGDDIKIKVPYYDVEASAEEQESALVFYNNSYFQNEGIDYAKESGETFDVVAAMSGQVVKAEKDDLLGYVVHIEHQDGVMTYYQSLENVKVEKGEEVVQGDVLGQAGRSAFNKDAGVHAHFEIRKDGQAVNPINYFEKSAASLEDVNASDEVKADDQDTESEKEERSETEDSEDKKAEPKDASAAMTNA